MAEGNKVVDEYGTEKKQDIDPATNGVEAPDSVKNNRHDSKPCDDGAPAT